MRIGVGGSQEIGIEASTLALHQEDEPIDFDNSRPPAYVDSHAYAAKLSWKAALNDIRLDARVRSWETDNHLFKVGGGAAFYIPSGNTNAFAGDAGAQITV